MSDKKQTEEALQKFCEAVSAYFSQELEVFELNEPLTVTVTKADGTYRKKAMIGGEEFTASSAYLGKKGNIIFVFHPNGPAEFKTMELSELEARRSLMPFDRYLSTAIEGPIGEQLRELRKQQELDKITQRIQQGTSVYGDGFGDF